MGENVPQLYNNRDTSEINRCGFENLTAKQIVFFL